MSFIVLPAQLPQQTAEVRLGSEQSLDSAVGHFSPPGGARKEVDCASSWEVKRGKCPQGEMTPGAQAGGGDVNMH